MTRAKVGLVLGGGGARGLAHIGIIKKLVEYQIPIHVITGASMGAIVGAAFAYDRNINRVESDFREFILGPNFQSLKGRLTDLNKVNQPEHFIRFVSNVVRRRIVINLAANRKSLIDARRLEFAINRLIPEGRIEDLKTPFACSALDLKSGNEIIFTRGDVRKALKASASIPGYLPPCEENGQMLVDGAVIDNFPIRAARMLGADFILACNVSPALKYTEQLENVIDIFIRAHHATVQRLNHLLMETSDFLLTPELGDLSWTEFEKIDTFVKLGEKVVEENIERLKRALQKYDKFSQRLKRWAARRLDIR